MKAATLTAPSPAFGTRTTADVQNVADATATHVIETELMRPAPRRVRRTREAQRRFLWAANNGVGVVLGWVWLGSPRTASASGLFYTGVFLLALIAVAFLYDIGRNHEDAREWLAKGVPVAGVVTERKHDAINLPNDYVVVFEFLKPPGGEIARQYVTVSEAQYNALAPGAVVTLVRHPHIRGLARPYFLFTAVEVI